jgi:hypothetical protein
MMSGQTKTVVGVLNVVDGEWTAEALNTLAVRDPSALEAHEAAKGDLFVLVDMSRHKLTAYANQQQARVLVESIRDAYYHSPAGVIASLRRALLDATASLPALAAGGVPAGLLAVVVRGTDVFIASAGPTVVYVVIENRALRFPERQPVLSITQEVPAPVFFHTAAATGASVVLGDSRFAALVAPEDIAPAVAHRDVDEALAGLGDLLAGQDGTLMVIQVEGVVDDGAYRAGRAARFPGRRGGPSDETSGDRVAADDGTSFWERLRAFLERLRHSEGARLLAYVARNLVRGALAFFVLVWRGLRVLFVNILPERRSAALEEHLPPHPAGSHPDYTAGPPGRRRAGDASVVPPANVGDFEAAGLEDDRPRRSQPLLRLVAIAIPLLVAVLAGLTYWRQGAALESTFQMLMEQAQALYQQALTADEPTARSLLDRAEQMLAEAATIRASDAGHLDLRGLVVQQQDKLNRVERLYLVGRLRTYDNPMTRLRRVVADGLDVFVLDSGADMVYYHRLDDVADSLRPDEGDPVVIRRAQQVQGNLVGELIDMTWAATAPDRRSGALLVLGADDLLAYAANEQPADLAIGGRDRWNQPVAAVGYGGNLYVLDPHAGQIFRYRPGAGGYPGLPESYLPAGSPPSTLAGAVDMAIDGYIYVLYADGGLRKFEGGVPTPFELQGLDRALLNPTALFTAPDPQAHYLYVADAGNRRIVQTEKDGRFVRQLKPADDGAVDFAGIRSIFVDEVAGKMYLVDGITLYIAAVPRLP